MFLYGLPDPFSRIQWELQREKYKTVPKRSQRAEKHKNWTKKHTRGVQQQTKWSRRKIEKLQHSVEL